MERPGLPRDLIAKGEEALVFTSPFRTVSLVIKQYGFKPYQVIQPGDRFTITKDEDGCPIVEAVVQTITSAVEHAGGNTTTQVEVTLEITI